MMKSTRQQEQPTRDSDRRPAVSMQRRSNSTAGSIRRMSDTAMSDAIANSSPNDTTTNPTGSSTIDSTVCATSDSTLSSSTTASITASSSIDSNCLIGSSTSTCHNNHNEMKRKQLQPQQKQQKQSTACGGLTSKGVCCSNYGNDDPVRRMIHTWVFGIMLPTACIMFHILQTQQPSEEVLSSSRASNKMSLAVQIVWTICSMLFIPLLAIAQGSWGILRFRAWFGNAPVPQTPVHGVVSAVHKEPLGDGGGMNNNLQHQRKQNAVDLVDDDRNATGSHNADSCSVLEDHERCTPIRLLVIGDSLAIGVGQSKSATPIMPEVMAKTLSRRLGRVVYWTCHGAPGASAGWIVRELERGVMANDGNDAIVEDQAKQPNTTATGVTDMVRRGAVADVQQLRRKTEAECIEDNTLRNHPFTSSSSTKFRKAQSKLLGDSDYNQFTIQSASSSSSTATSSSSDTDECSSSDEELDDASSTESKRRVLGRLQRLAAPVVGENGEVAYSRTGTCVHVPKTGGLDKNSKVENKWKHRLSHHRKRLFNTPDQALGPYDIVVVITGSNDLKSAFFPFLLSGEDAELRRQARERGGSYTKELRLLVETLYKKMRLRIQSIRDHVGAATETVREKVEETMELCLTLSSPSPSFHQRHSEHDGIEVEDHSQLDQSTLGQSQSTMKTDKGSCVSRRPLRKKNKMKMASLTRSTNNDDAILDDIHYSMQTGHSRRFPLVVLPGMPARALPIFRTKPLRWLAVPIVDIMDMHKRNMAKAHPGEVLFVKAPSVNELTEYYCKQGSVWRDQCQEETIIALTDIRKRDRTRIEQDMFDYYDGQNDSSGRPSFVSRISAAASWLPLCKHQDQSLVNLFSVDQIHPNDRGYDFWGRFIGDAIVEEWLTSSEQEPR